MQEFDSPDMKLSDQEPGVQSVRQGAFWNKQNHLFYISYRNKDPTSNSSLKKVCPKRKKSPNSERTVARLLHCGKRRIQTYCQRTHRSLFSPRSMCTYAARRSWFSVETKDKNFKETLKVLFFYALEWAISPRNELNRLHFPACLAAVP